MPANQKEILTRTVEALEKSYQRYPDNEKILLQLAVALSQLGRYDPRSSSIYRLAAEKFPADVKVQRANSVCYLIYNTPEFLNEIQSLRELDQAGINRGIEKLEKLNQDYPDSAYIHQGLANLLMIAERYREAIHHYRCAMALGLANLQDTCAFFERIRQLSDPPNSAVIFFAELYQRLGNIDSADELFRELLQNKKPDRFVLDKYSEFLRRRIDELGQREPALLAQYIRQFINVLLLRGNASEAVTWAQQLTPGQIAKDASLARTLAKRLIAMEDFRQAFEYLSKIPLDFPTKTLLNEMAMMLEKRGELDTAVYILQYINDNDEFSAANSGATPVPSGDSEAEAPQQKRQSDIDLEIEMELQMAERHWKNKRWDQSFESYLTVLELGFQDYGNILEPLDLLITRVSEVNIDQLVFLTNFFAQRQDWRHTITYGLRSLKLDSQRTDMSQRVLQAAERLLIDNPADCEIRLVLADEHLRLNHIEKAIAEYRRTAETPEFKMKANRRLARAHAKAGDLNSALNHYKELPVLDQEDLEKLYDLMISFSADEQFKEAFETARIIREYDPNFMDIEEKSAEYEEKMNRENLGFVIDPKMRELIGDHSIGRYKYIGKIGSGGMGVVHKVLDLRSNTVVAMKILREGLSSSGKALDRFFREARIAATIHHNNIVNILDYNISNNYGQSYIAMEFVDGPSLRDVVENKFAETVEIERDDILQALHWCSQLCDALDATHKKGIIHRDIKPDNIMIAPGDLVKITDFGIVHIEEATFTPTGALIGTPRYMSPEQVHGGRIDGRSDIYAAGIILYELLIGSPPFISGDISYQQVNVIPISPKEICPAIPGSVDRIIMRCLEKAPGDRYQAALDVKSDIDEAYMRLGGSPSKFQGATTPGHHSTGITTAEHRMLRQPPEDDISRVPTPAEPVHVSASIEPGDSGEHRKPDPRYGKPQDLESDLDDLQESEVDTDFDDLD